MVGTADFVQGVDQGVLVLGLECNVEIDGGVSTRVAQARPVHWDRIPLVLYMHVFPTWCEGRRKAAAEHSGEDTEHREQVVIPHRCHAAKLSGLTSSDVEA